MKYRVVSMPAEHDQEIWLAIAEGVLMRAKRVGADWIGVPLFGKDDAAIHLLPEQILPRGTVLEITV